MAAQLPTKEKKPPEGMVYQGKRKQQSFFSACFSTADLHKMLLGDFLVALQPA